MLTYATLGDFKRAKQVDSITTGVESADRRAMDYLIRATRFINRFTKRDFFPFVETRSYPVPHRFLDLRMRRFPTADLYVNQDLLEVIELTNGDGEVLQSGTEYFLLDPNIYPKYAIALKFPKYWGGIFNSGLLSYNFNEPTISVKGVWGYHDEYNMSDMAWVDTNDVLKTDIDADTKEIPVNAVSSVDKLGLTAFDAGRLIKVDDEFMEIISLSSSGGNHRLNVIRGIRGTQATSHSVDTPIYRWRVVDDIVEAALMIAKTWREADTAAGGRLGVSDVSVGVEISIPADPLNILKMYVRSIVGQQ